MSYKIAFAGGTNEIGANSSYLYLDGTGIVIDSGLHPKRRDSGMFPDYSIIGTHPVDLLLLTHAHTDHIGALPYLIKLFPHILIFTTEATCELSGIMLRDTSKLINKELNTSLSPKTLSLYKPEILEKIGLLIRGFKYGNTIQFKGNAGRTDVNITFFPAGHILGSSSILIECGGRTLLHTGDINFSNQKVMAKASLPRLHLDCLITECTNSEEDTLPSWQTEQKRLASFINETACNNGSVLIPAFALGKTQEMLKVIYSLIKKGSIPRMPVYTGGLSKKISNLYDKFCYKENLIQPGFEISDIEQCDFFYKTLMNGDYFKEPSIVLAQSGMLNPFTVSNRLAKKWLMLKNFGIAFAGYQDEDSQGYSLLKSKDEPFCEFNGKRTERKCRIEKFRFSSHASRDEILNYTIETKPGIIFLIHGSETAQLNLAELIYDNLHSSELLLPETGKYYDL